MGSSGRQSENSKTNPGGSSPSLATGPFSASDFPVDDQGRIYHLQVKPGQIAPDILLVGDPGRAEWIGENFLSSVEFEHEHRGLVTVTGTAEISGEPATIISPLKTTIATSGMGTPSLEIIAQELVALNEIDFETRTRKPEFPRLHVIRVGTSGGIQAATQLGTPIITTYAIGMDSTGQYYEVPYADEHCRRIEAELPAVLKSAMQPGSRFYGLINPYVARAEPCLVKALSSAAERLGVQTRHGLTISCPGFFAPQGRDTARVRPSLPDLDVVFSRYDPRLDGQQVENMEMETSFLLYFLAGLGYWAGTICPAIANRYENSFLPNYQDAVKNATRVALLALAELRKQDQETIRP